MSSIPQTTHNSMASTGPTYPFYVPRYGWVTNTLEWHAFLFRYMDLVRAYNDLVHICDEIQKQSI